MLYMCQSSCEHPIAKAIIEKVQNMAALSESEDLFLTDIANIDGEGLVANIG